MLQEPLQEDWPVLLSLISENWRELAHKNDLGKGLRKDKEIENDLRRPLIHISCVYSIREPVAR